VDSGGFARGRDGPSRPMLLSTKDSLRPSHGWIHISFWRPGPGRKSRLCNQVFTTMVDHAVSHRCGPAFTSSLPFPSLPFPSLLSLSPFKWLCLVIPANDLDRGRLSTDIERPLSQDRIYSEWEGYEVTLSMSGALAGTWRAVDVVNSIGEKIPRPLHPQSACLHPPLLLANEAALCSHCKDHLGFRRAQMHMYHTQRCTKKIQVNPSPL